MSQHPRRILVECKPDEVLIRALEIPGMRIFHHSGKGNICRRLQRLQNAIAIMDEDPHSLQPHYLRGPSSVSSQVAGEAGAFNIRVLWDDERGHLILILCPRLEVARRNQIDVQQFGLPDQEADLHRVITNRLRNFKQLVDRLKEIKSPELQFLQQQLKGRLEQK